MKQKECRLLYSLYDMKQFLYSCAKTSYSLHSLYMDGQKVFIVSFYDDEMLQSFESVIKKSKPTMIGCIYAEEIDLQKETLNSLRDYIRELEKYEPNTETPKFIGSTSIENEKIAGAAC